MTDKVKVVELDPQLQEYIDNFLKGDQLTLRAAVLAATDEEVASTRRDGEAAVLFNTLRNTPLGCKMSRFGDVGYLLPSSYREDADKVRSMAVRPDDVWVVTFPRSGTTWTRELLWLLKNDLDYDKALNTPLIVRNIYLESMHIRNPVIAHKDEMDEELKKAVTFMRSVETIASEPSPRVISSHLPLSLLPAGLLDTAKVVYVARDPRDVAVSFYNLFKSFYNYGEGFKTFWNLFVDDLVCYGPFFPRLKEAWALRDHPNMLFMFYEDIVRDLPSCIKRIATFIEKQVSNEQIDKLCEHLNIQNFRKNPSVNRFSNNPELEGFVRKGKVGGWREHFDAEMAAQAQQWMRGNLAGCDLRFPDHSS